MAIAIALVPHISTTASYLCHRKLKNGGNYVDRSHYFGIPERGSSQLHQRRWMEG